MHLFIVWPTWHTWGRCWRKEAGICRQNLPRGVGTRSGLLHPNTHISLPHTVCNREIWGICNKYVGDGTQDFAPGMRACSIRTCHIPLGIPLIGTQVFGQCCMHVYIHLNCSLLISVSECVFLVKYRACQHHQSALHAFLHLNWLVWTLSVPLSLSGRPGEELFGTTSFWWQWDSVITLS